MLTAACRTTSRESRDGGQLLMPLLGLLCCFWQSRDELTLLFKSFLYSEITAKTVLLTLKPAVKLWPSYCGFTARLLFYSFRTMGL